MCNVCNVYDGEKWVRISVAEGGVMSDHPDVPYSLNV
jgi:hypothetical protein